MITQISGKPFSKDPAIVKFKGNYWLYYSVPPYQGKPTIGWTIAPPCGSNEVATSPIALISLPTRSAGESSDTMLLLYTAWSVSAKVNTRPSRSGTNSNRCSYLAGSFTRQCRS